MKLLLQVKMGISEKLKLNGALRTNLEAYFRLCAKK